MARVSALVTEDTEGRGAEDKTLRGPGREFEPAGGQDPEDVSVTKQEHIAAGGLGAPDDGAGARCRLFDGFAIRRTIVPQGPAGVLFAKFGGGAAFDIAVRPLAQVRLDVGDTLVAGEAARLPGALEGAHQHQRETPAGEIASDGQSAVASLPGQGDVGAASVRAREAPFGFAVADEPDFRGPGVREPGDVSPEAAGSGLSGRGLRTSAPGGRGPEVGDGSPGVAGFGLLAAGLGTRGRGTGVWDGRGLLSRLARCGRGRPEVGEFA